MRHSTMQQNLLQCKRAVQAILLLIAILHTVESADRIVTRPVNCSDGNSVLRGEYFEIATETNQPVDSCLYSLENSPGNVSTIHPDNRDQQYAFFRSGKINYLCSSSGMTNNINGSFNVVEARHQISLCSSCSTKDVVVNQGDVLSWTFGTRDFCNVELSNASSCSTASQLAVTGQSYMFNESGVYYLRCEGNCTLLANITVLQEGNATTTLLPTCTPQARLNELIYSHAAIMAITFGLLLPLGALLASCKIHLAHMIIQPLGLLLAVVGLALSVTYMTVNNKNHFQQLHSVFGFILILVAALIQPVMRLLILAPVKDVWESRFSAWHKRLGIAIIFFGMSNVFLGLLLLPGSPYYIKIIYGVWVALAVFIYVVVGAYKRQEKKTPTYSKALEADCQNCSPYRNATSDVIALNRINSSPSKLSKGVISDSKFVQLRKTSVDMSMDVKPMATLQVPVCVEEEDEDNKEVEEKKEEQPKPRRKLSNVHFALTMAAQQTPPVPHTPPVEHKGLPKFAFTNRTSLDHTADDDKYVSSDEESSYDSSAGSDAVDTPNTPITPATPFSVENFNVRSSVDSITSQGSIRITRHSGRAHAKADEIFQRGASMRASNKRIPIVNTPSPLTQHSVSQPLSPPPPQRQESQSSSRASSSDPDDTENSIKQWPDSSNGCPLHQPNAANTGTSPLHQRRMRKMAIGLEQPDQTALLLPPPKPTDIFRRSPSRSPTRKRTQRDMLVDNALRSVMSMSEDAIVCANAQGELVFWSSGAVKMFGYTPGEAIGSSLQMIMPHRYKERHQGGINNKTDEAIKYIRKHGSAPEEQKHARLYAVHGMSKTGNEFAVDVVVSSFVIEGEIFYTGIITEVNRGGGLTRNQSLSALSTETEIREKHQKAMAIGAQMKISHKLRSAEHISKKELKRLLEGSLTSTEFEVTSEELNSMVEGILKAGDKDNHDVIKFVDLIDLLSKHRLYISDSGLIAKYGKTKGAESAMSIKEKVCMKVSEVVSNHLPIIAWTSAYVMLNLVLLLIGMLTTDKTGWGRVAYGTGPVLSMNCVLVLLPMLYSMIHAMRGNLWLNKVLPLTRPIFFHLLIVGGIFFWTGVHLLTHIGSFALDNRNDSVPSHEHFRNSLITNLNPFITGLLVIIFLVVLSISSLPPLQSVCRFIGFHVIHWTGMIFIYLILIIHGVNHYNPSFWKWLLPALLIFVAERLYRFFVIKKYRVKVHMAAKYDELSRVGKVEVVKPKYFHFNPGQYVLIKIPQIGPLSWHPAIISCSPKEENLTFFLPWKGDRWLQQVFKEFKKNPLRTPERTSATPPTVLIRGPYGMGTDLLFDQKFAVLVCGGNGPHVSKAIIQKFLQYRKASACNCGCHPVLSKLYFVWATPSGNDFEWFTDYLSEINEDEHLMKYLDIRVFLTNINSPPDELASALLHLGLKTADSNTIVKRPSLPQLNNLHTSTSYGFPDFEALLDFVSARHATSTDKKIECGVFTIGELPYSMVSDLKKCCKICSEKKGPKPSPAELMASPYRKRSIPEPEDIAQIPKEWHIEFKLHKIIT